MALRKQFIDAAGVVHPTAYWKPVTIAIDVVGRVIVVTFRPWRDKAASDGGLEPVNGSRVYRVSGAEFATLMAAHVAPGGPSLPALIYQHAKSRDSFFDGAQDV